MTSRYEKLQAEHAEAQKALAAEAKVIGEGDYLYLTRSHKGTRTITTAIPGSNETGIDHCTGGA